MTAELIPTSDTPVASPERSEHLLDLLDVAAAGPNGLIFLEDGIDAPPLKLTYAELRDRAKVGISDDHRRTTVDNFDRDMALPCVNLESSDQAKLLSRISIRTSKM
jgi:hypothetical protein